MFRRGPVEVLAGGRRQTPLERLTRLAGKRSAPCVGVEDEERTQQEAKHHKTSGKKLQQNKLVTNGIVLVEI